MDRVVDVVNDIHMSKYYELFVLAIHISVGMWYISLAIQGFSTGEICMPKGTGFALLVTGISVMLYHGLSIYTRKEMKKRRARNLILD